MDGAAPEVIEVQRFGLRLPITTNEVIPGDIRLTTENRKHLVQTVAAIERSNQWLHDTYCTSYCASIAPGFQVVRTGDMPIAHRSGFIEVEAPVDFQRDFVDDRCEIRIHRTFVNRIAARNQQHVDFSGIDVGK